MFFVSGARESSLFVAQKEFEETVESPSWIDTVDEMISQFFPNIVNVRIKGAFDVESCEGVVYFLF